MKIAADKGQVESMFTYAQMFHFGNGVQVDLEEACRYYKMASDKGHINAMNSYGMMLKKGVGVEKIIDEAIRYFKKAADKSRNSYHIKI